MEENKTEVISNQPPIPGPKKRSKLVYLILALIILVILTFAVSIGVNLYKTSIAKPTPTPLSQNLSPTPNPMAKWKTYAVNRYGFVFNYPQTWSLSKTSTYYYAKLTKGGNQILFNHAGRGYGPTRTEAYKLGGIDTEKLIIEDENKRITQFAIKEVQHGNFPIIVYVSIDTKSPDYVNTLAEIDQILSTLKFTN